MKKLLLLSLLLPVFSVQAKTATEKACDTERQFCTTYQVTIPDYPQQELIDFVLKQTFDAENKTLSDLGALTKQQAADNIAFEPEEGEVGVTFNTAVKAETTWSDPVSVGEFTQISRQDILVDKENRHSHYKNYYLLQAGELHTYLIIEDLLTEKGKEILPQKLFHLFAQKLTENLNISLAEAEEYIKLSTPEDEDPSAINVNFHLAPNEIVFEYEYPIHLAGEELKGLLKPKVLATIKQWPTE